MEHAVSCRAKPSVARWPVSKQAKANATLTSEGWEGHRGWEGSPAGGEREPGPLGGRGANLGNGRGEVGSAGRSEGPARSPGLSCEGSVNMEAGPRARGQGLEAHSAGLGLPEEQDPRSKRHGSREGQAGGGAAAGASGKECGGARGQGSSLVLALESPPTAPPSWVGKRWEGVRQNWGSLGGGIPVARAVKSELAFIEKVSPSLPPPSPECGDSTSSLQPQGDGSRGAEVPAAPRLCSPWCALQVKGPPERQSTCSPGKEAHGWAQARNG